MSDELLPPISPAPEQTPQPVPGSEGTPSPQPTGVPIWDVSGEKPVLGHIDHNELHDAVASGKFSLPQETTVPVFSPDGHLGTIDSSEAKDAFNGGYKYATPEAINDYRLSTPEQQAMAGVEGLASGIVSKPIAHGLEIASGLTTGKDIEARERLHPWTSGIGEGVGLVGGAFTGAGEAAVLSHAGETMVKVLGAGGEGLLSKIGARTLSDATQMALYQGGNEVSKLIDGDPNQSAGTALSNISLSAALGGGAGLAFGVASPIWKATVGDRVGKFANDIAGRLGFLKDNPDLVGGAVKEATELHNSITGAVDETFGPAGIKAQGITKALPELTEDMGEQSQKVADKLQGQITKMTENPKRYPQHLTERLQDDYNDYLAKVTHPDAGSNELFNAQQDLKQKLQAYSKFDKNIGLLSPEHDFVKDMKGVANSLRTGLEDSDVWGKAGDLQQKLNAAFVEHLPAIKDFESTFGSKVGNEVQMDPNKWQTFVNNAGEAKASIKTQKLENFIKSSEKYLDIVSDVHKSLGSEPPFQPQSMTVLKSLLGKATAGSRVADYVVKTGINRLSGNALGASSGAALGHMIGAGQLGAMIGQQALGPMFESVFHSIAKPVMEAAGNSSGFKAALDYSLAVAKGEAAMNNTIKGVFKAAGETSSDNLGSVLNERAKLDSRLESIKQDPSKLSSVGGDVGHYLPQHAAAMAATTAAATQYLSNLKPKPTAGLPLDSKVPPDPVAQAQYHRALDIANNPLIVVRSIAKGTLTPQDIQHLHATNPGAYQRLSQKLTTEMMAQVSKGETIPYKTRLQLSMFLGQPLDSTMTPAGIMGAQPKPQQSQPATAQTPSNRPKSSTKDLGNLAKQSRTLGQSREERSDKT